MIVILDSLPQVEMAVIHNLSLTVPIAVFG